MLIPLTIVATVMFVLFIAVWLKTESALWRTVAAVGMVLSVLAATAVALRTFGFL